ncbi:MAG: UvrD-helicase domain-containing protein, partial [Campylobacterota bacterium]|nr:UvrD-helicase domain-containing protein [Campylobacterota bacterium]
MTKEQELERLKKEVAFIENDKKEALKILNNLKGDTQIYNDKDIKKSDISLSQEQLEAINCNDKYILLKARAGSGKTLVVSERIKRLLKNNTKAYELLILAFNKDASKEINNRVHQNFDRAKTFHSFARSLIKNQNLDILGNQDDFIQKIVIENKNKLFDFDKKIKTEFNELELNLSIDEFVNYIRNNNTLTFKGTNIKSEHKSNGEKYISDFLFENDIEFEYEKSFNWNDKSYKPDFSIFANSDNNPNIILEHWGINENNPNSKTPIGWKKSWQEYKDEMDRKSEFWKNRSETFIETSINDFNPKGKESFLNKLENKLQKVGVKLNQLSNEEIYKRLKFKSILNITEQIRNFINSAKQHDLTPDKLKEKIEDYRDNKELYNFYIFANFIYREYEKKLKKDNLIDFNDMLILGERDMTINSISKLKHIMIDEFQDFNLLFYKLIDKIKKLNHKINIFVVGDDWQAINSFAGADLKYFNNFKEYFHNSTYKSMLTNYRSCKNIVEFSNNILDGEKSISNKDGGEIFFSSTVCKYKNIEDIYNKNQDKKIAVLFRTNNELNSLAKIKNIKYETVHKSKGLQWDIVIIFDSSKFDASHPDNKLSSIFGRTDKDFVADEKRLFYVAVTRAKEKLFIFNKNSFFDNKNLERFKI